VRDFIRSQLWMVSYAKKTGMERPDIQGKVYPGFGRCIYCGSNGGDRGLGDEHIIPFSLGGNAVIRQASCSDCEAKTSYIDGYLARAIFGQFRVLTGIQTRNPRQRPRTFGAVLKINNNIIEERSIPREDHPLFLMTPIMPLPGILRGELPSQEFPGTTVTLHYGLHDNMHERLNIDPKYRIQMKVDTNINLPTIGRALAKIAYCNAVALFGLDGFRHLVLPQIICSTYPYVAHYVGGDGAARLPPPDRSGAVHLLDFGAVQTGRLQLLVASIRLFSYYHADPEQGQPIYKVVVGAPRKNAPVFSGSGRNAGEGLYSAAAFFGERGPG